MKTVLIQFPYISIVEPKTLNKEPRNITIMPEDELWNKWIENPNTLVDSEKIVWLELQGIINDLLNELHTKNKIRKSFTPDELTHLKKMLKNRNYISENFEKIANTTDSLEINANFVGTIRKFNFTDINYVYMLVELSIMNLINDNETIKTVLLFHLKEIKGYKATDFATTMKEFAPINYKRLEPYLNSKFRNSLAHGTWAIENNQIVLFGDAKLIPFEKLEVIDFLLKVREQNVVLGCIWSVISDKIEKGFFSAGNKENDQCRLI